MTLSPELTARPQDRLMTFSESYRRAGRLAIIERSAGPLIHTCATSTFTLC